MCAPVAAGCHFGRPGRVRSRIEPESTVMIGLVLVTHGRLAVEFRSALEHVVGAQTQIETISIDPDDDIERRRHDIVDAVAKVSDGSGVSS